MVSVKDAQEIYIKFCVPQSPPLGQRMLPCNAAALRSCGASRVHFSFENCTQSMARRSFVSPLLDSL